MPREDRPRAASGARQRDRAHAGDGMEQLEQVRRPRGRCRGARDGRRDGEQRHARGRLRLRQHRRHLGGRPARRAGEHHDEQQVPRHEGARRLRPLEGAQARDLFVARADDLCRIHRELWPRGAGRAHLRRVGDRLPQVRLVRRAHAAPTRRTCRRLYQIMGDALLATGRPILYSLCQYGRMEVWKWGADVGGNSWRTTGDIRDTWESMAASGSVRTCSRRTRSPATSTIPTCWRSATAG